MKILIVEDELDARKVLTYLLKRFFPEIEIVGETGSVSEAKQLIIKHQPELVFLDVRLEDGTGIELLQETEPNDFQTIFTTAYDSYAIKAIKFDAVDYLLKPIDPEELKRAVLKAIKRHKVLQELSSLQNKSQFLLNKNAISVKTSEQNYLLPVDKIIHLEADGAYTTIVTKDNRVVTSKNLKFYENILPAAIFIRTHQSHIVNKNYIRSMNKFGYLELLNKETIPVSFRKRAMVRKCLKNKN